MNNNNPEVYREDEDYEVEIEVSQGDTYEDVEQMIKASFGRFPEEPKPLKLSNGDNTQWIIGENGKFIPCGTTQERLTPGVYEVRESQQGIYLEKIPEKTESLLRFSQNNSQEIIDEINTFWKSAEKYEKYGITQKRGVLLYGSAGSGKSSIIRNLMQDVIAQDGIIVRFTNPSVLIQGLRIIRQIQDTPIIVLMEDLESIISYWGDESEILNILDGVHQVSKVLFLATTNYPEKLGSRVINRPNRFDKRYKIDVPNDESRREFLVYLSKGDIEGNELEKWVKDTKGFSLAHLKELFVGVILLGNQYKDQLKNLKDMSKKISSEDDEDNSQSVVGFRRRVRDDA